MPLKLCYLFNKEHNTSGENDTYTNLAEWHTATLSAAQVYNGLQQFREKQNLRGKLKRI